MEPSSNTNNTIPRDPLNDIEPFQTGGAVTPKFYFFYNNILMIIQALFSLIGIVFTGTMLVIGRDPSIYLPIMMGLIMTWIPSPLSHKITPINTPTNTVSNALTRRQPVVRQRRQPTTPVVADNSENV